MTGTLINAQNFARLALSSVLLLTLLACPESEPPTVLRSVDSPEAGIRLTDLPEGFRLVSSDGGEIVLERKPELPPGTAVIAATEEQDSGVNLFKAVNDQKEDIESRPEGKFQGQTELGSHLGPAYLTRGRWSDNGAETEEMRLFALHPTGNRMVVITYTYAVSGDTKDRASQAMEILGFIEGLDAEPTEDEEEGAGEGAPA